jgi:hypothetical protein
LKRYWFHIALIAFLLGLMPCSVTGQSHSKYGSWNNTRYYRGLYIGGGLSGIDMDGDYGSKQAGGITHSYSLLMEAKFKSWMILRGTLSGGGLSERFIGKFGYLDFTSSYRSADFSFSYLFSPLAKCDVPIQIRPYVNIGLGLLNFESFADLHDGSGNAYYFWNDGSVRLSPEDGNDDDKIPKVQRDGIFESPLDSLDLVPSYTGIIPLEVGLRFMFSSNFGVYLSARYTISTTDYIDQGIAYRDKYLTDRAKLNHYPDGYYAYSLMVVYKFREIGDKPRYKKTLRKPVQCRKFG